MDLKSKIGGKLAAQSDEYFIQSPSSTRSTSCWRSITDSRKRNLRGLVLCVLGTIGDCPHEGGTVIIGVSRVYLFDYVLSCKIEIMGLGIYAFEDEITVRKK